MREKAKSAAVVTLIIITLCNLFVSTNASEKPPAFKSQINYGKIYTGGSVYGDVIWQLENLHKSNPSFTDMFYAGSSVDSRQLPVFRIGNGSRKILIDAELHSREYITTILTLNQIEYLIYSYKNNMTVDGINVKKLLDTISIWYMPMMNPDGLELCTRGTKSIHNPALKSALPKWDSFKTLKDNLRGVNLNGNFDVEWKTKSTKPFSTNYSGKAPFSEPESKAFKNLCTQNSFDLYITYHAAGELLYWYYNQQGSNESRDYSIAKTLLQATGYTLISKEYSLNSSSRGGGSREWFVNTFKKPGFTIEIGKGALTEGPLHFSGYPAIWNKNKNIPILAANAALQKVEPAAESGLTVLVTNM